MMTVNDLGEKTWENIWPYTCYKQSGLTKRKEVINQTLHIVNGCFFHCCYFDELYNYQIQKNPLPIILMYLLPFFRVAFTLGETVPC